MSLTISNPCILDLTGQDDCKDKDELLAQDVCNLYEQGMIYEKDSHLSTSTCLPVELSNTKDVTTCVTTNLGLSLNGKH